MVQLKTRKHFAKLGSILKYDGIKEALYYDHLETRFRNEIYNYLTSIGSKIFGRKYRSLIARHYLAYFDRDRMLVNLKKINSNMDMNDLEAGLMD